MPYNGTIDLISGVRAKGGGSFPLVDARDVYVSDGVSVADALAGGAIPQGPGVSIKSFGAVGDGAADDSDALAEAAASGEAVYFPEGTYLLHRQIDLTADINWYGDGEKSVVKFMPSDRTRPEEYGDGTVYNSYMMCLSADAEPCAFVLRDIVLDANKDAWDSDALSNGATRYDHTTCADLNGPSRVYMRNVVIRNALIEGCYICNTSECPVMISDCKFLDNGYYQEDASGLHIEGENPYTVISNCIFNGNGFHGLLLGGAARTTVNGITCNNNGHAGVCLWGGAKYNVLSGVSAKGNQSGVQLCGAYSRQIPDKDAERYARENIITGLKTDTNVYGVTFGNSRGTLISGWLSHSDEYSCNIAYNADFSQEVTGRIVNHFFGCLAGERTVSTSDGKSDRFNVTVEASSAAVGLTVADGKLCIEYESEVSA